jgi:hypothetical protein
MWLIATRGETYMARTLLIQEANIITLLEQQKLPQPHVPQTSSVSSAVAKGTCLTIAKKTKKSNGRLAQGNAAHDNNRDTDGTVMVCMARVVRVDNLPLTPPPRIAVNFTTQCLLDVSNYVSLVVRIDKALLFNTARECYLSNRPVPSLYTGDMEPLDKPLWILIHDYLLKDIQHRHGSQIIYPGPSSQPLFTKEIVLILREIYDIEPNRYPHCFNWWHSLVCSYTDF